METRNIVNIVSTLLLLVLAFSMASTSALGAVMNSNPAAAASTAAKIWTNKPDYQPGTVVTLYGTGFKPLGHVTLTVTKMKDRTYTTWTVRADAQGDLTTTYQICPQGAPLFDVSATDGTNTAKTTFTDSSLVLSPNNGNVGQTITVSYTSGGFTIGDTMTATWDSASIALSGTTTVDGSVILPGSLLLFQLLLQGLTQLK